MFLKQGIFINWGNIPHLAFEFGPINLFSGGNGSGKTTAADGIQALMTAAHENLFTFNPGQDETTQRGRGGKQVRTLASYVLGCDDGSYARVNDTDAYVVGVFHPTQGEVGEPFTAVMGMRAHIDRAGSQAQARLDELVFFIVPGETLGLGHFVKAYADGEHVVPITQIGDLLRREFGKRTVEAYDKKRAYLRRLYGALRGRADAVSDREAQHCARTFANFMAYKPVKSINDFVAQEILERKDLGDTIRTVSDLMKTIHEMEQDAGAIKQSIETLAQAQTLAQAYIHSWVELCMSHYAQAAHSHSLNQRRYLEEKKAQKAVQAQIEETDKKISLSDTRRKQTHQEIVSLEAQRQGITALKDKDSLERAIERARQALVDQAGPLLEHDRRLNDNIRFTRQLMEKLKEQSLGVEIAEFDSKAFLNQGQALLVEGQAPGIDLPQLMGNDWIDISPLEHHLDQILDSEALHNRWAERLHNAQESSAQVSLRDQLSRLVARLETKQQQTQRQLAQKRQEITLLESRKVSYPPYVELALQAIHQQCPEADAQVLCDYVEITDPQWQMAIEGYIGGARFSILVQSDYEAQAIRIVRALPGGNRNRARVIQGKKAQRDAERLTLAEDSIVHVMQFSHKTAEFYLKASYGQVVRVADAQALRTTARGITSDGLGSGSYSMWRCDLPDAELVFGQGARERALRAKEAEYESLSVQGHQGEQQYHRTARVFDLIEGIKAVRFSEVVQDMLRIHRELRQAQTSLANLDLEDFQALEDQLAQTKARYEALEQQSKLLIDTRGGLKANLEQKGERVKTLADEQEALSEAREAQEAIVNTISTYYADFNADERLAQADEQARQLADPRPFGAQIEALTRQRESQERELHKVVLEHNQRCNPHDALVYDIGFDEVHSAAFFKRMVNLHGELASIHNRLKNNVLVERHDKLLGLKESFNTAFVTNLCHSIYQAINDGKRLLEDLNGELEHHRFGTDQERFYFAWQWVAEYREYWRFFKEVIKAPTLGDGTTLFDASLSEASCAVRDKLMSMLLDKDGQQALRELERISDYRKYRDYEIYKEPLGKAAIALSQYGTGSGGQLETPAYIIRSAAVTSAFRFNEGHAHLRMVLVDEAFSKMDEARSREVIRYLTQTLGLQLVFIMPTSKSGPFMDMISNQFVFSKCPVAKPIGELNTRVFVDRKQCDQDKIRDLWANHRRVIQHQGALEFMQGIGES